MKSNPWFAVNTSVKYNLYFCYLLKISWLKKMTEIYDKFLFPFSYFTNYGTGDVYEFVDATAVQNFHVTWTWENEQFQQIGERTWGYRKSIEENSFYTPSTRFPRTGEPEARRWTLVARDMARTRHITGDGIARDRSRLSGNLALQSMQIKSRAVNTKRIVKSSE